MTTDRTRIAIVDDHPLFRSSLVKLIGEGGSHEVVGEAGTLADARALLSRESPDVLVLDLTLPDGSGLDLVAELAGSDARPAIVLLTMHGDDRHVTAAAELGVDAYLTKQSSASEILAAVAAVVAGESYVSPEIAKRLLSLRGRERTGTDLTTREAEVLGRLARGARLDEIAAELFISPKTVKNHLTSVYAKIGVETGAQAVAEAYRRGLVDLPGERD